MIRSTCLPPRVATLLTSGLVVALLITATPVVAEPIRVSGYASIDSAGGDFPNYDGPVNELIYFLAGRGLPAGYGEVFETIPAIGTRGNLQVGRSATPQPMVAGASHSLSTRATFTFGRARDETFLRTYDIAGDFRFTAGTAVLHQAGPFDVLVGRAPVTFDGTLRAFDIDTGALLFRQSLYGSGTGWVTFSPSNPPFFNYSYSLTPVPEPTTLLLLGGGLGWVGARLRRRNDERSRLSRELAESRRRTGRPIPQATSGIVRPLSAKAPIQHREGRLDRKM